MFAFAQNGYLDQPASYVYIRCMYVYTSLYIKKEQRWILADITRSIGNDIFIYTGVYIYVYIYVCVRRNSGSSSLYKSKHQSNSNSQYA